MWKKGKDRLIPVTDPTRKSFKTYISNQQLKYLYEMAEQYDTHIAYLLENGLNNLIKDNSFYFDKTQRLRDKVEFRTTCSKETLVIAQNIAKDHKLNFTDIIQAAVNYIEPSKVKNKSWRSRIEQEGVYNSQ